MITFRRAWSVSAVTLLLVAAGGCRPSPAPEPPAPGSDPPADRAHAEMYLRVCDVGMAYSKAAEALGRSPTSLAELEPYLVKPESRTSLRDGKPFEIRAVEGVNVGGPKDRLLVWEATADATGERYVFQESQGGDRVGEAEFRELLDGTWTRERWLPRKPLFPKHKP